MSAAWNPPFTLFRLPALLLLCLAAGCTSPKKDPRDGRIPPGPPEFPTGIAAVAADGFSTVYWNTMVNATTYNVYWSTSAGVTASSNLVSGVSPPFKFSGLTNGQTIFYKIQSSGKFGTSTLSSEFSTLPANGAGTTDTLFPDQWHLDNTGQAGGIAGEDINVDTVWSSCAGAATCRGEGVLIAVTDDGLELAHEDIFANIAPGKSYNYVKGTTDPAYTSITDGHGHMVAGIAAARDLNDTGVRGVAPRAQLVGYNVLQKLTLANEADSMIRNASEVSVNTNSWGAPDGTGDLAASTATWKAAIETGLATGRGGLGTIYTWAAGNGGFTADATTGIDDSNHDGQANHRGVMAVGAVLDSGLRADYSERGANLWLSAPAGDDCTTGHTITTTDRTAQGGNNFTGATGDYASLAYTKCMNGTSAATPVVAGAAALVIQKKPTLGWRDVRVILATTARRNTPGDARWLTNGAGIFYNHNYGFGVVNAQAAVTAAAAYGANLGAEETLTTPIDTPNLAIPDNDAVTGVSSTITVAASGITKIEFIEVTFSAADHTGMEDLEVTLTNTSTAGSAISVLAEKHACTDGPGGCTPFDAWVFGDAFHLNEPADGVWRLTVKDKTATRTGTFQSWRLKFYGT